VRFEVHVLLRWWELGELVAAPDPESAPPHLEELEARWLMNNGVVEYTIPHLP
jgi:hypothetical protein